MALKVKPNPGHYALAMLAEKNPDFLCLSQNVDSQYPFSFVHFHFHPISGNPALSIP